MANLPILEVETAHSRYVIDQNRGVYTRTRVHQDANDLSGWDIVDGQEVEYSEFLLAPEIGNRMAIAHANGSFICSTTVQSIREIHPETASA